MAGKEMICGGFRNSLNDAGILNREKTLGHDDVKKIVRTSVATATSSVAV